MKLKYTLQKIRQTSDNNTFNKTDDTDENFNLYRNDLMVDLCDSDDESNDKLSVINKLKKNISRNCNFKNKRNIGYINDNNFNFNKINKNIQINELLVNKLGGEDNNIKKKINNYIDDKPKFIYGKKRHRLKKKN